VIATAAETRADTIGRLNNRCRHGLDRTARITVTAACLAALSDESLASRAIGQAHLLQGLRRCTFDSRDTERSRGSFTVRDTKVYFTIDYYDTRLEWGSEDPADASVTTRVVTLMLAGDL
jgi:hypothetical protein